MRAWEPVLPALSGLLLWLSFPKFSLYPLAWVALIPYLFFCLTPRSSTGLIAGHFLMGGFYFGGTLYWITDVLSIYGGLDRVTAHGVYSLLVVLLSSLYLPMALAARMIGRRSIALGLLLFPALWLAFELLRNEVPFGGFPWASLAYSQWRYALVIQIAELGGAYWLSFLIALCNCALLALAWKRMRLFAGVVLLLFLAANGYGWYRLKAVQSGSEERVMVGLIQPWIELGRDRNYYAGRYFEDLPAMYRQAVAAGAELVVFPEAQNPYYYPADFYFRTYWEKLVARLGVPLIFNSASADPADPERYFNSVHLLNRKGQAAFRYAKTHLVPFGEYLPWADWLGLAGALVAEVSHFSPGTELNVGEFDGSSFGALVCYEAIFPEISRDLTLAGAQFLINVTNDSWFGDSAAPFQHLETAALRAVETRRSLVRVANSGISGVVAPSGEIRDRIDLWNQGIRVAPVELRNERTFYVRFGQTTCLGSIMVLLLSAVPRFLREVRKES